MYGLSQSEEIQIPMILEGHETTHRGIDRKIGALETGAAVGIALAQ